MATLESLQKELEIYKKDLDKIEANLANHHQESNTKTDKYLGGINSIMESQSELRHLIVKNSEEIDLVIQDILLLKAYVDELKENDTLDQLRKMKEYFEKNKDLELYDFVYSTKKTLSMLSTVAYIYGASLAALFFQLVTEFIKLGKG